MAVAGTGNSMINSGDYSQRFSGRSISKRGQVKLGIVFGLARSFTSIFSSKCSSARTAGTRTSMINGGDYSQRFSGRLIPKRGKVKLGIVLCLAHSFASICSSKCSSARTAGTRNSMINGGGYSQRFSGRLIPKRGQVKLGIVLCLAHSFASIFSIKCTSARISH